MTAAVSPECVQLRSELMKARKNRRRWKQTGSNYAVVHRMAVAADSHGKGLGVKIYEEAEKLARSRKASSVRADTHQENIAMQRTMEKKRLSAVRHHPYQGRRRRRTTAHRRGETIVLKKMRYHMNGKNRSNLRRD